MLPPPSGLKWGTDGVTSFTETMQMKAVCSSEILSSTYSVTWCHNHEYRTLGRDNIFKNRKILLREKI
jgi:hypothetical protein